MKKIILFSVIFVLIGAGCSVRSGGNESISNKLYDYQISIVKSEKNIHNISLQGKKEATMLELLSQPITKFESTQNGEEKVTKLDGVIATASKVWNLYINDKKIEFTKLSDIKVSTKDKIEWRYEAQKLIN